MEYVQIKEGLFDGVKSLFQKGMQRLQVPPNYVMSPCTLQFDQGRIKADRITGVSIKYSKNAIEVFVGLEREGAFVKGNATFYGSSAMVTTAPEDSMKLYDYAVSKRYNVIDFSKLLEVGGAIWIPQQQKMLQQKM